MKRLFKLFALAGACAVIGSASADENFDWTGEGGVVTVPAGTTAYVADSDKAAIEALTSITLEASSSQLYFTNTVPITIAAAISGPGGGNATHQIVQAAGSTVTFNGSVFFQSSNTRFTLANATVNGKFGGNANYYYVTVRSGCDVYFSSTAQIVRRYLGYFSGPGTYHFDCRVPYDKGQTFAQFNAGTSKIVAGENMVWAGGPLNFDASGSAIGGLDLAGHDLTINGLYGGTASANAAPLVVPVTSASPATLTMSYSGAAGNYDKNASNSIAFQGAVSVVYNSVLTNTLVNGISTTTGSLEVRKGALAISGNARWEGPTVNVTGGMLTASGTSGSFGENTAVVVSGDGVLNIPTGARVQLKSLKVGDTVIDVSYPRTVAQIVEDYGLTGGLIGGGAISAPITYYVDDENGDDEKSGRSAANAKKTLAGLFEDPAFEFGTKTTVVVKPGVYASGTMTKGGNDFRVAIPDNVTVVSSDGAAVTIIDGQATVRGVNVGTGSRIEGFTIRNCTGDANGGGVVGQGNGYKPGESWIVDCTITNCWTTGSPGGAGYYGKYLRCRVLDCRAAGYGSGIRCGSAYNCYFKDCNCIGEFDAGSGNNVEVIGCTFVHSSHNAVRSFEGGTVRGCLFIGTSAPANVVGTRFENCVYTAEPLAGAVTNNCLKTTSSAVALDSFGRPKKNSVAVNRGDYAGYLAAMPANAEPALDGAKGTRVYLGEMDVGCYECDPRAEMAEVLNAAGAVEVRSVSGDVAFGERGVTIPDGETVELVLSKFADAETTFFLFRVTVPEGGTLTWNSNELAAGEQTVKFTGSTDQEIVFAYTGDGAAEIHGFDNTPPNATINVPDAGVAIIGASVGVNYLNGDSLTFTLARAYDSEYLSTGFNSNGVFCAWEDYPAGFTYTVANDQESSITIDIVYADSTTEWYVNADPLKGSDENRGYHPDCPFLTLAEAMKHATSGDTVHAARGVYAQGCMGNLAASAKERGDFTAGYCRVVVPSGVTLVADEGRDVTFIEGAKAEPADARVQHEGCGTNSLRCAFLRPNSTLRGFTLRNGYARSTAADAGEYAGGVRSDLPSAVGGLSEKVIDCVISNCFAHGGAAGYSCTFTRCRVENNRSTLGYRVAVTDSNVFNSYFRSNTTPQTNQGHLTDCRDVVNCTFAAGQPGLRASGHATKCYNCVFLDVPISQDPGSNHPQFHNCAAKQMPTIAAEKYDWDSDCQVIAGLGIRSDLSPRQRSVRDSSAGYTYYTNRVVTVIGETEAALDINGNPRCGDGVIDLGCSQSSAKPSGMMLMVW